MLAFRKFSWCHTAPRSNSAPMCPALRNQTTHGIFSTISDTYSASPLWAPSTWRTPKAALNSQYHETLATQSPAKSPKTFYTHKYYPHQH